MMESLSAQESDVPSPLAFKIVLCTEACDAFGCRQLHLPGKQRPVREQRFCAESASGLCQQKKSILENEELEFERCA